MPPTFTTILAEHLARARQPPGARGGRRRGDQCRHHLSRARRQAHDGRAPRRRRRHRARRRPAGQFLQAGGRSAVRLGRRGLGPQGAGADPHRHGLGRLRGSQAIVAAGGSVIAQDEATSVVWGMPGQVAHAGVCSAVLPLDEIAAEADAPVRGGHRHDPARLRLSAQAAEGALRPRAVGRQAVSRRKPAAAGRAQARACRRSTELVAKLKAAQRRAARRRRGRGDDHQRDVLLPRQDAVRPFPRHHHAGAARGARAREAHPHLVRRRPPPARSPIRWR